MDVGVAGEVGDGAANICVACPLKKVRAALSTASIAVDASMRVKSFALSGSAKLVKYNTAHGERQ
jgi:hypothetical protein